MSTYETAQLQHGKYGYKFILCKARGSKDIFEIYLNCEDVPEKILKFYIGCFTTVDEENIVQEFDVIKAGLIEVSKKIIDASDPDKKTKSVAP